MKLSILCLPCVALSLFPITVLGFCFDEAGKEYGINPALLESIARVESNLNPKAINKNINGTFDIGLMQINSGWLTSMSVSAHDLLDDACLNTMTGAWILRQCIDRHGYTWEAVGCYNAMSRDKKVNYAWKVFYQLKGGRTKSTKGRQKNNTLLAKNPNRSSLVFRARDVTETERVTQ
jgi:soluble lytic murein transglycosylase-like protein